MKASTCIYIIDKNFPLAFRLVARPADWPLEKKQHILIPVDYQCNL